MMNVYNLIVIGAGINGAGIARDAARRGLSVLLIDKADVGSGTSSWSTRLIHGGLRYLEHAEFGLVRESLRERETLLKIAPHLVRQLPILLPIYRQSRRGQGKIRTGMLVYDLLSLDKSLPWHRMLSRNEALERVPGLNPEGLISAAVYNDAQVEFPERLVLENVLAAQASGAAIVTYAQVTKLLTEAGHCRGVEFVNRAGDSQPAYGEVIVNAVGPWVDQLLAEVAEPSERLIGGTKGSHIVVAPFPGAPSCAVYIEAEIDGRPFFVIPWNGSYLIGTTDIRFEDDPDEARSEPWEVNYLLSEVNRVFPRAKLARSNISFTYSGVRPLPYTDGEREASITRRHFVRQHARLDNLLSVVGGKLTTYRSLAEECVDLVAIKLRKQLPACVTATEPLPGAHEYFPFSDGFRKRNSFVPAVTERLLRIYGTRANEVEKICARELVLGQTFNQAADAVAAEIVLAFESELAQTLSDCLLRRTMLGLKADLALGDDEKAAAVARDFLGWSESRAAEEVATYRAIVGRLRVQV
jgi:glycerol-3-phosphate dehydrogenase